MLRYMVVGVEAVSEPVDLKHGSKFFCWWNFSESWIARLNAGWLGCTLAHTLRSNRTYNVIGSNRNRIKLTGTYCICNSYLTAVLKYLTVFAEEIFKYKLYILISHYCRTKKRFFILVFSLGTMNSGHHCEVRRGGGGLLTKSHVYQTIMVLSYCWRAPVKRAKAANNVGRAWKSQPETCGGKK